jgi:hypothetical protein
MSNYSKTTDFAAKDALATGNANKIVKGTEIDDEFDAIQTAVNSKADTNNAALTGTPTAPTASAGTDSTQLSTTAFVKDAIDTAIDTAVAAAKAALFPVGTIYTQAAVSTNPGTLLGFGTWTAFGTGRVLVGLDGGNTAFDTLEETGGSETVTPTGTNSGTALTEAQMPKHYHLMLGPNSVTSPQGSGSSVGVYGGGTPDDSTQAYGTYSTGGSAASGSQTTGTSNGNTHTHTFTGNSQTNLQPYIVVYMWKRTA